MRVAIYNRWLPIGGGGERHGVAIGTALAAQGHAVTLLTNQRVDAGWLGARLGLDLQGITIATLPDSAQSRWVGQYAKDFDLFVNASHGDFVPPLAARNALLTFFPHELPLDPAGAGLLLDGGFYALEQQAGQTFRWSDGAGELRLAPAPDGSRLRLRLSAERPATWPAPDVELRDGSGSLLDRRLLPLGKPLDWTLPLPRSLCRDGGLVTIASPYFVPAQATGGGDQRMLGVQLLGAELLPPGRLFRNVPRFGGDLTTLPEAPLAREALAGYDLVLANSGYTARWIERRWGRRSHLLYPPVAIEQLAPLPKQQQILSVGRFFTGLHAKGQLELVAAFRQLCDQGLRGWQLTLAGALDTAQPAHLAYVAAVRAAASGYPVEVLVNVDAEQLRRLYGEATLYWHAAGLGADGEREPERCEHFGISIVEAMATGCVPLAYGCGGPAEIVTGEAGELWHDLPALQRLTSELLADDARRQRMAAAARQRSQAFGWAPFVQALGAALA